MITDASNDYFLVCFYLERGRETPERSSRSIMRSERRGVEAGPAWRREEATAAEPAMS